MAEALIELLSEEIPARFQEQACLQLKDRLSALLHDHALPFSEVTTYVTPRRLVAHIQGLPSQQPHRTELRKGPRVDAPPQALEGFLATTDRSLDQCHQETTPKGTFWMVALEHPGRPTLNVLADVIPTLLSTFVWPKSMRWGSTMGTWVRPLRSILGLFEGQVIPASWNGVSASDQTQGHPILCPDFFTVTDWASYTQGLGERYVMLNRSEKIACIRHGVAAHAAEIGAQDYSAPRLYEEVAGLVEWPWFLSGSIPQKFMTLPVEVLETTLRVHQRYFLLNTPGDSSTPAPYFVMVTNMPTDDTHRAATMREGNEKVLTARLEDALFYWGRDCALSLETMAQGLTSRFLHQKLGTMAQKTHRLQLLMAAMGLTSTDAHQAAAWAKADLCSGVVGEFPELQGIMGGYYARNSGVPEAPAQAIAQQYLPQGPDAPCPQGALAVALSLADKIDTLVGFFAVGLGPTGSKDPFALRRAALGIVRLAGNEGGYQPGALRLTTLVRIALQQYQDQGLITADLPATAATIMAFLQERLRVAQRDQGRDGALIDVAFGAREGAQETQAWEGDIASFMVDLTMLGDFFATDQGQQLLTAARRVASMLASLPPRAGSESGTVTSVPPPGYNCEPAELKLQAAVDQADAEAAGSLLGHLQRGASLAPVVTAFLDEVFVATPDPEVRALRQNLVERAQKILHAPGPLQFLWA